MNKKAFAEGVFEQGLALWEETHDIQKVMDYWDRNQQTTRRLLGLTTSRRKAIVQRPEECGRDIGEEG